MLTNERRQQAEREIVRATIEAVLALGFKLHDVDETRVHSVDEAIEEVFALDSARIWFKCPGYKSGMPCSWVFAVMGNDGWDVIADYTLDLDKAIESTEALVNKWEEEAYNAD